MVIKSSKALLMIYTSLKLASLARMQLPTALQVSMQERNITIECELTMRLRPLHIAVRRTPPRFPIFPPHQIQRKQGATGTYTQIATPGANVTTYTDSSALLDGTQYYYKVCATNSAGDSAYSNEVNGTTPLINPSSLTATVVSTTQVNLNWTDNSRAETAYLIERKATSTGNYSQIGSVGMNVQSYADTYNFASGTAYYYRVRATSTTNGTIYSGYSNAPHVMPNP